MNKPAIRWSIVVNDIETKTKTCGKSSRFIIPTFFVGS